MRRLFGAGAAAFFLIFPAPAPAHDFWIEPSTFSPEPVATVRADLKVGEDFDGRSVRRSAAHIERFFVVGPGGERSVPGREGTTPAGLAPIDGRGAHLIGYVSTGSAINLPAARFESYLEHEGLEGIVRQRRERGESSQPGRELFVRSAKSLLHAGEEGEGFGRLLGLPLELVPLLDPATVAPGDSLELELRFRGQPVADVLVRLRGHQRPADPASRRTGADGRVGFTVDGAGPWLATAVHMERAEDAAEADWRSFWASLTFSGPPEDRSERPGRR